MVLRFLFTFNTSTIVLSLLIYALLTGIAALMTYRSAWRGIQIFVLICGIVLYACGLILVNGQSIGSDMLGRLLFGPAGLILTLGVLIGWIIKCIAKHKNNNK